MSDTGRWSMNKLVPSINTLGPSVPVGPPELDRVKCAVSRYAAGDSAIESDLLAMLGLS